MECAERPDFAHGLHTEGFVYVNVCCVVIVLVIAVVVYLCDRYLKCCVMVDFTISMLLVRENTSTQLWFTQ